MHLIKICFERILVRACGCSLDFEAYMCFIKPRLKRILFRVCGFKYDFESLSPVNTKETNEDSIGITILFFSHVGFNIVASKLVFWLDVPL